jgi:hypothetical protein
MITHTRPTVAGEQPKAPAHRSWVRSHPSISRAFGAFALLALGLTLWISTDPVLVPEAVDRVREVVGPGPAAQIETWAFQLQDALRHAHDQATGAQPHRAARRRPGSAGAA